MCVRATYNPHVYTQHYMHLMCVTHMLHRFNIEVVTSLYHTSYGIKSVCSVHTYVRRAQLSLNLTLACSKNACA